MRKLYHTSKSVEHGVRGSETCFQPTGRKPCCLQGPFCDLYFRKRHFALVHGTQVGLANPPINLIPENGHLPRSDDANFNSVLINPSDADLNAVTYHDALTFTSTKDQHSDIP